MLKKFLFIIILVIIFIYSCDEAKELYNANADIHTFIEFDTVNVKVISNINVVNINTNFTIRNLFQNIDSVSHDIITVYTIPCHAQINIFKKDTFNRWQKLERHSIDSIAIPSIAPSKFFEINIDTSFNEAGYYKIKTTADYFSLVEERNKNNNSDSLEIRVDTLSPKKINIFSKKN
ncbi:MAG: hypothetical protein B6I24_05605 [Bacteroidetes bacterium 4572_128]|nr:MAG: hypothetical protein B6I24_05605 [Bacteroidetes bacterium 4572_128]